MNVVVDTSLEVEASWLPVLLHVGIDVIVVKEILRDKGNQEETQEVGLKSSVEGLDVATPFLVAFVTQDLKLVSN